MSLDRAFMQQEFRRLKPSFLKKNPENWILNLAAYSPANDSVSLDANVFDNFEILEDSQCKNSNNAKQHLVQ